MPINIEKFSIYHEMRELKSLLSLLKDAVDEEGRKWLEETEEFESTPIDPNADEGWVEHRYGELDDHFFRIIRYQLWVYGGFMVTVLTWLGDIAVGYSSPKKHASHAIWMQEMGEKVKIEREGPLGPILDAWLTESPDLLKRLRTWIKVRDRYVHSHGLVADGKERKRFEATLGIDFDPDKCMQLTYEFCESLLEDALAGALIIMEKAKNPA